MRFKLVYHPGAERLVQAHPVGSGGSFPGADISGTSGSRPELKKQSSIFSGRSQTSGDRVLDQYQKGLDTLALARQQTQTGIELENTTLGF